MSTTEAIIMLTRVYTYRNQSTVWFEAGKRLTSTVNTMLYYV